MNIYFDHLFFWSISIFSSIQTNEALYRSRIFRRSVDDDDNSSENRTVVFFQNEPIPLASSIVDDLTTLASAIYIVTVILVVFILLAWITHYNAPCSSMITSILSAITGLPEPIIHSVALCGSCCMWCETTWLFRRIHQFNRWISNKIKGFFSVTCKVLYDTICPCCQPPDTPSNRSIIGNYRNSFSTEPILSFFLSGSLPATIIAMINVPASPDPPAPIVTTISPNVERSRPIKSRVNAKKRRKKPRKRTQSKQRSAIDEISENNEEEIDEDDDDDDESDEDAEIY